jgi:hypothetical protein
MSTLKIKTIAKDSVPYSAEIDLEDWAAKAFADIMAGKSAEDKIFNLVSSGDVGAFIKEFASDASPKTMRSAWGCGLLCDELLAANVQKSWPDYKKKEAFVKANLAVAKKLNHQKGLAKNHAEQEAKVDERVEAARKIAAEKETKAKKALADLKRKLVLAEEKGNKDAAKTLKERIKKTNEAVKKAKARVQDLESQRGIKKATVTTNLGTSLNSYCSPDIVCSWCNEVGMSAEKIYSKAQLVKFADSVETAADYWHQFCGWL